MMNMSEEMGLKQETYYISMCILDTYLSKTVRIVLPDQFQLLGVECLFLAVKFEEILPFKL